MADSASGSPPPTDDIAALRSELAELREAMTELREARTEPARREAREDIAESEKELERLAARVGLTGEQMRRAIADTQRAQRKSELREILTELLAELPDDDDDDGDGKPDDTKKPPAGTGDTKPKPDAKDPPDPKAPPAPDPKAPPPPADEPPGATHWSERRIGEMLR